MTTNFASVAPGRKPRYHRQHGVSATLDIHILKIRDRTHLLLDPRDYANYERAPQVPGMFFVLGVDLLVHFHYVPVPTKNIFYFLLCRHHWQPIYPYAIFSWVNFRVAHPKILPLEFLTSMYPISRCQHVFDAQTEPGIPGLSQNAPQPQTQTEVKQSLNHILPSEGSPLTGYLDDHKPFFRITW